MLTRWTIPERKDLRAEVMLLQLSTFPEVPRSDRVIQPAGPQPDAVGADVDAGSAIRVTLELSHQRLVVQVPHGNVAIAAAREAHLRVGTDGQRVAGRSRRGEFSLDSRCRTRQIPDGQVRCFPADDQRPAVRQELHRADVVVTLL